MSMVLERILRRRSLPHFESAVLVAVVTTLAVITARSFSYKRKKTKTIESPAKTLLPTLTQPEIDALPYPPDALPGGRDVESPYGTTRVYEWGPETGRKVLLVHGVTTSSIALGAIAHGLVERGCRVMLLDFWGRGYSDSPTDLDHDERLYTTQILLAITSSPLSWTGKGGFSFAGYSLGGGIAAMFAGYFPHLVNSLVLLVPAGLIREHHLATEMRLLSLVNLFPDSLTESFVRRKLRAPLFMHEKSTAEETRSVEVRPASLKYPHVNEHEATQWQILAHEGFFNSIISTARNFHGSGQQESWKRLQTLSGRILIIAGQRDPIICADELKEDVMEVLGAEKIEWRVLDGAHDISNTHSGEIAEEIHEFWGL